MKYLFIDTFAGSHSTGRIAAAQCRQLTAAGHDCVLAYGREKYGCEDINTHLIGSKFDYCVHGALTRLFDLHGFGFCSYHATKKFIQWVDEYNPDVIWLHNVHGYYLNLPLLFTWMKHHPEKEYHWTLHDCWSFTGHCAYFTAAHCEQWQVECSHCVQKRTYPSCIGLGAAKRNYYQKKTTFTGVKNLTIRTPSKWLANLVKRSFLKDYQTEVVYNRVDCDVFHPLRSSFRRKYGLDAQKILLAVANVWDERKGLRDLMQLANMLCSDSALVIVGLSRKQIKQISTHIKGLRKITSPSRYSSVFVFCDAHDTQKNSHLISNQTTNKTAANSNFQIIKSAVSESRWVKPDVEALYKAICIQDQLIRDKTKLSRLILIEHTENVAELVDIYSAADTLINPTHEDNYPTVNLEAIACGTKVITYDIGGCKETIKVPWQA